MASFTFGSFGDIITLTQIAYKVYDAIDSNGDIAKRVKVSQQDRETFLNVCASIERTLKVGGPMSEDDAAVLKRVVTECYEFLAEFEKYLETFNESRHIVRVARRVQSALFKKDKSSHFQDRMRHHSTMVGLVLGPIQAKYCSQDLKAHITRSLEPWDQKPMQLQDALGRRYPVPLEVCSSFDVSHRAHHVLARSSIDILPGATELSSVRIQIKTLYSFSGQTATILADYTNRLGFPELVHSSRRRLEVCSPARDSPRHVFLQPAPGKERRPAQKLERAWKDRRGPSSRNQTR